MALFRNTSGKLSEIAEKNIQLEKHLQTLTEENMQTVFGLSFIATEFEHDGLRLDTVAFDSSVNAFVIIEYKRDRSFSVVDQGYAYLSLLLNNKAEFILLYNECVGKPISKNDVDWSQSRVMFVAQSFTIHQHQAINFRDMPIELWRVKLYANDTVLYDQLKPKTTSQSIKVVSKDPEVQKVNSQVRVYEVGDHFTGKREAMRNLYELLRDKLMILAPTVYENPRGGYIGFSLRENGNDTFVYIHVQTGGLQLTIPRIRPEDIADPLHLVTYKPNSLEHKNTPESTIHVGNDEDIDYVVTVLRQVLRLKFK